MSISSLSSSSSSSSHTPCFLNRYIDSKRYFLKQCLGSGGYGIVYLADDLVSPTSEQVAIKCMRRTPKIMSDKDFDESSLHHRASQLPGVVKYIRSFEEDGYSFLVLEYCPAGDLFHIMTEGQFYYRRDDVIKKVFIQILDAVQGLHNMNIYHRDLKPENIMCREGGLGVMISDFGLATEFEVTKEYGCGSYYYMTPECIAGRYSKALRGYSSRASDIWAMGIILINIVTLRSPWKGATPDDPTFMLYTRNPQALRRLLGVSEPTFNFLDRIFRYHGHNVTISELRAEFTNIDTFYATPEEIEALEIALPASTTSRTLMYRSINSDSDLSESWESDISDDESIRAELRVINVGDEAFSIGSTSSSDEPHEAVTPETNATQLPDVVPDFPGGECLVGQLDVPPEHPPASKKHAGVMLGRKLQTGVEAI